MKKIIIPTIIIPVLLYLLFVVNLSDITSHSIEIKANNKSGTFLEIDVEDQSFIEEINSIITEKSYYIKQPLYNNYSRREIDFEIKIFNMNEENEIVSRYKILLNTDNESNVANRSRIDVTRMGSGIESKLNSFSIFLTDEQVEKLTNCIQKYVSQ